MGLKVYTGKEWEELAKQGICTRIGCGKPADSDYKMGTYSQCKAHEALCENDDNPTSDPDDGWCPACHAAFGEIY